MIPELIKSPMLTTVSNVKASEEKCLLDSEAMPAPDEDNIVWNINTLTFPDLFISRIAIDIHNHSPNSEQ